MGPRLLPAVHAWQSCPVPIPGAYSEASPAKSGFQATNKRELVTMSTICEILP